MKRAADGRTQTDTDAAEYGGAGRWGVGLVDVLVAVERCAGCGRCFSLVCSVKEEVSNDG